MADKLALRARSVRKLRPCSGCAVVVPQQTAQPLTATHAGAPERAGLGHDQLVAEPLMVALPVVVRHELVEGAEQPVGESATYDGGPAFYRCHASMIAPYQGQGS